MHHVLSKTAMLPAELKLEILQPAGIKAKVDNNSLLDRAVTSANMPPSNSAGPDPTAAQRNMIKCWIEDGAPDN